MAAPIIGKIAYHAGTSGTVTLAAGEILLGVWCVATGSSGTLTVAGGNTITLVQNIPFQFGVESGTAEWAGVALVFSNTVSYFVKSLTKFP